LFFGEIRPYKSGGDEDKYLERTNFESSAVWGDRYVGDRNNARIQVFDADGSYLSESQHPGTPCGLFMGADQHIWLAHGHTGQIMKFDLNGKVVGTMAGAGQGKALGKHGEAHYIAVGPQILTADRGRASRLRGLSRCTKNL
jgi:hypothetical protein